MSRAEAGESRMSANGFENLCILLRKNESLFKLGYARTAPAEILSRNISLDS